MLNYVKHQTILFAKKVIYGRFGEPYSLAGRSLRYIPGTRPVRLTHSTNNGDDNARYDALR